jgi:hypothetical protein
VDFMPFFALTVSKPRLMDDLIVEASWIGNHEVRQFLPHTLHGVT